MYQAQDNTNAESGILFDCIIKYDIGSNCSESCKSSICLLKQVTFCIVYRCNSEEKWYILMETHAVTIT